MLAKIVALALIIPDSMSICSKQLVGCLLDFGLPVLDHKPTVFLGMCRFDYPVCPAARQDPRLGEEALAMDLESNASELQYTKEKTWFKGDQTTTRKWNPESCSSLAFGMWSVDRNVVETRRQVKPCARLPPGQLDGFWMVLTMGSGDVEWFQRFDGTGTPDALFGVHINHTLEIVPSTVNPFKKTRCTLSCFAPPYIHSISTTFPSQSLIRVMAR